MLEGVEERSLAMLGMTGKLFCHPECVIGDPKKGYDGL